MVRVRPVSRGFTNERRGPGLSPGPLLSLVKPRLTGRTLTILTGLLAAFDLYALRLLNGGRSSHRHLQHTVLKAGLDPASSTPSGSITLRLKEPKRIQIEGGEESGEDGEGSTG